MDETSWQLLTLCSITKRPWFLSYLSENVINLSVVLLVSTTAMLLGKLYLAIFIYLVIFFKRKKWYLSLYCMCGQFPLMDGWLQSPLSSSSPAYPFLLTGSLSFSELKVFNFHLFDCLFTSMILSPSLSLFFPSFLHSFIPSFLPSCDSYCGWWAVP